MPSAVVDIELSGSHVFVAGSSRTVSGAVRLTLARPLKAKSVKTLLLGVAVGTWVSAEWGGARRFSGAREFHLRERLWEAPGGVIPAGATSVPFDLGPIEAAAPPSFEEHINFVRGFGGFVRYWVLAQVSTPLGHRNVKRYAPLTVLSFTPPSEKWVTENEEFDRAWALRRGGHAGPDWRLPVPPTEQTYLEPCTVASTKAFGLATPLTRGEIEVSVRVPRRAFGYGEVIVAAVCVRNRSNAAVRDVDAAIRQRSEGTPEGAPPGRWCRDVVVLSTGRRVEPGQVAEFSVCIRAPPVAPTFDFTMWFRFGLRIRHTLDVDVRYNSVGRRLSACVDIELNSGPGSSAAAAVWGPERIDDLAATLRPAIEFKVYKSEGAMLRGRHVQVLCLPVDQQFALPQEAPASAVMPSGPLCTEPCFVAIIRSGKQMTVAGCEVVHTVILKEGDRVAADLVLAWLMNVSADGTLLTATLAQHSCHCHLAGHGLPEEFSIVLTMFMSLGTWCISRSMVLMWHNSAIKTLGTCSVLCTEETGILTINQMMVQVLWEWSTDHTFQFRNAANSIKAVDEQCHLIVFVAGSSRTVSGAVRLTLARPLKAKSVTTVLVGAATGHWVQPQGSFSSGAREFHVRERRWEPPGGVIPAGASCVTFDLGPIEATAPPSYEEHTSFLRGFGGMVRYWVLVVVATPPGSYDIKRYAPLTVLSYTPASEKWVSRNEEIGQEWALRRGGRPGPDWRMPVPPTEETYREPCTVASTKAFGLAALLTRGEIEVSVRVPRRAYGYGEVIVADVCVRNRSSAAVRDVEAAIRQRSEGTPAAVAPPGMWSRDIAVLSTGRRVEAGQVAEFSVCIRAPPVTPSFFLASFAEFDLRVRHTLDVDVRYNSVGTRLSARVEIELNSGPGDGAAAAVWGPKRIDELVSTLKPAIEFKVYKSEGAMLRGSHVQVLCLPVDQQFALPEDTPAPAEVPSGPLCTEPCFVAVNTNPPLSEYPS
eukprot:m51a1_g11575 putative haloacid dehalogenase (986) ;mRNA; f:25969-30495